MLCLCHGPWAFPHTHPCHWQTPQDCWHIRGASSPKGLHHHHQDLQPCQMGILSATLACHGTHLRGIDTPFEGVFVIYFVTLDLIWFVLPVLPYFGRPNQKTNPDLNSFFPHLRCNLIPCHNKLSIPGMLEFLAYMYIYIYSSVWNACAWKNFSGPKQFFLPLASFTI